MIDILFSNNFFDISSGLLVIGLMGTLVTRKNLISVMISIEIMMLGVSLNFIFFSYQIDDAVGMIFSLTILAVIAAESAIGLAIFIAYYKLVGDIDIDNLSNLKG